MSVRKSKHQQRISKRGHVRFEYDIKVNGKRTIRTFECHPNQVQSEYAKRLASEVKPAQVKKFFQIKNQYLASRQSTKHSKAIQFVLDNFAKYIGDVSLNSIKKYNIQDYLATLGRYSASTKRLHRMLLSGFFTWTIDRELYTSVNPCSRIKDEPRPTRHPRLTVNQVNELLDNVTGHTKTAVMLAVYAGLRISEISTLQWYDIDFSSKHVAVRAENSKSGKRRLIPLAKTLQAYLAPIRGIGRVVPRSVESIRKSFAQSRITFNFAADLHFHDLRHVFALKSAAAGVSMEVISEWLGHANLLITQKYYAQSVQAEQGHKEIDLLDKMIAKN